jgi:hypothetical protein
LILNEPVAALASDPSGRFLAIATAETIAVIDMEDGIRSRDDAIMILPRRGAALGQTTGLAIEVSGNEFTLHVAGTEGIASLTALIPAE